MRTLHLCGDLHRCILILEYLVSKPYNTVPCSCCLLLAKISASLAFHTLPGILFSNALISLMFKLYALLIHFSFWKSTYFVGSETIPILNKCSLSTQSRVKTSCDFLKHSGFSNFPFCRVYPFKHISLHSYWEF